MGGVDPATEIAALRNLLRMQPLGEMVEAAFGSRCPDYNPDCACCRAWRWLDVVRVVAGSEMTAAVTESGTHKQE